MPNLKPYRTKAQKAEARRTARKLRTAPGAAKRRSACMASQANGTGTKAIKWPVREPRRPRRRDAAE